MQVIILAAGMGKRLGQKTQKHTKSMVKILGKTFLEHSLDKLTKFQISRIIIVIGYFGDEVREVIGDHYNGVPVFYVENKDYETTNNIYSLFLAKDYLQQEDTLLLESDLIYEETIIRKLLNNPFPNLAVVDKYKSYMDGTVVKINRGGLGIDKTFLGFCQIHVKKLDKSVKICELLKHNIVFCQIYNRGRNFSHLKNT